MFKLRTGYFVSGITTGLILLFSFFWTLPDGKLHIVFCDVGQGDGAYIRFPDGRDMVVDGGPDDKIINCLGKHMPFWDRQINIVAMTHPQKDHMQGLISVFGRYRVDYFLRSDVENETEGYVLLQRVVAEKHIPVKFIVEGEKVAIGPTSLSLLWPSAEQIAKNKEFIRPPLAGLQGEALQNKSNVLGVSVVGDLNDYCLVFLLSYGNFDALFTGDADNRVEANYPYNLLANKSIELLKVPHHGSKTGMTDEFITAVHPKLAIISVGKNSYGHPSEAAMRQLRQVDSKIMRTDQEGDIEIISDGKGWEIKTEKKIL